LVVYDEAHKKLF